MAYDSNKYQGQGGRIVPLVVVVVICLALALGYSREDEYGVLHSIQGAVGGLFTPASSAGVAADSAVESAGTAAQDALASDETLSELREEIASLRQQLAEAEEYKQQAQSLQELLYLKDVYNIEGVAAQVIGRSSDSWNKTITIDAGSDDGVLVGETVTGSTGVIGQIISVSAGQSTVRLITDSQSGAAVMIQSNRKEGIVRGSLDGLLYLKNVDSDVTVQVGDVIVTSGMGGSYVRGLIVGQVVKVSDASGDASRTIVVSPNDDPSTVETVMVVKSMNSSGAAA